MDMMLKCFLAPVVLLLAIGGGWSLDCKVCVDGIFQNYGGEPEQMDSDFYLVFIEDDAVKCWDVSPNDHVVTCAPGDDDACIKYSMDFTINDSGPVAYKTEEYRCGKKSEIPGDSYCQQFNDRNAINTMFDGELL